MPRSFVAYLRVYEPLSSFDATSRDRLERALRAGPLDPSLVADREREVWLRTQLASPVRLFPGDGAPAGRRLEGLTDVLVLHPEDVSTLDGPGTGSRPTTGSGAATTGPTGNDLPGGGPVRVPSGEDADADFEQELLVCPLDIRARAAAGMVGFLSTASPPLLAEALPLAPDAVRSRAAAVVAEMAGGAVHVVSSTWSVPLPWFSLVDPAARRLVLAPLDDPERRVSWRVPLADARRRAEHAHGVVRESIGPEGPAALLRDTGRWLDHFHPDSALELDYGGLVQLMDDEELSEDTSAQDVHRMVEAFEEGEAEVIAELYEKLRDFWAEVASRERFS
ncbi:hypothetical protein FHR81_003650 [Actinoalloteichus hoggarensis]|uniref:DUF8083 domain-containing protein n=1 Tax=Actinoalloteichus hoggarensis TaxID=1470176 RepID=A0A221WA99_9PSEU|nr:hypothetical protein [Actinoalloteichus hoggarensis]ASO22988.1 hypothetical protein AHOG_26950 [Actinoalloteichus hoggarensis]MBB5922593.1 hypothetical protein [Actinoalloteichus hoggarensis]